MSLAKLFYIKETFRESVRRWRQACFRKRSHARREQRFILEALEPRVLLSATPTEVVTSQQLEPAAVTVPAGSLPGLDVDLNGQADALTDGILIIRHLFGFTGTALTDGVVDPAGRRTDPTEIQNYLNSINRVLDIDLNQNTDALSDGIAIIRSLFGFTGTALTDGVVDPAGQRTDPTTIATFLDNMNPARELVAPLLTAGLQQDTGLSPADAITFNPTITGTVADISAIASFTAGFDAMPVASFADVLADLLPTGNFTLTTARLDQLAGGTLADGAHTLHLRVTDARGNFSTLDRTFTVDRSIPVITSFGLSAGSDTGIQGDNITGAAQVLFTGSSEAAAALTLNGTAILAGAGGVFQIPDVALTTGDNSFTLFAQDLAGNSAQQALTVTRQGSVTADVALQWNQQALDAVRLTVTDPPVATRILAMVSLAQYDTLAAIEGTPAYLVKQTAGGPISLDAALAKAAHTVLYSLFPSLRSNFDAALNTVLNAIPNGAAKDNALSLGLSVGNNVLAIRATDGSNAFVDYPGSTLAGQWRPDAPMFDVADEPQWGDVTPFALTTPEQFRPVAPPALTSAAYAQSVEEVKSLGSATSTTRIEEQTQIAQFWADGKGSYTPPGHWNLIAQQVALTKGNSLSSNVRLLAQLNVALADAGIAAWDAKYTYGLWRPIDAIQNADVDNNTATTADANWTPLLITPSHPEYVSGHSTFSSAAATILAATFGSNTTFSTTAFTLPGVTRNFASFTEAAQEAGRSRIYGGIHYEFTNQAGQQLGQEVANAVLARFVLSQDIQPPSIIANSTPPITNTNITLNGQIIDNLSGVANAQFKIDSGALQNLVLGSQGQFAIATGFVLDGTQDGTHTITILAKDAANNSAPTFTRTVTLDTRLPILTLNSIADNAAIDSASRLTGTADPTGSALTVLNYQFDNGPTRSLIFDNTTGAFDELITIGNLSEGSHTLTITARDAGGNQATLTRHVTLPQAIPFTITGVTPTGGAGDVGVTYRPQILFSRAVDPATLTNNSFYATGPDGLKIQATIVPAQDGSFAWLFFANPLPGGSTITLHVNGELIRSLGDQIKLDADGNGAAGGTFTSSFTTVSRTSIPGTTLVGKVVDPGPDLEPMTFDDIRRGPDGIIHTADDVLVNPIAHAKVFILGQEDKFVFTDVSGNFELTNVPVGNVKVAIDGRTATNPPTGVFFPEMVMDLTIRPGQANTVMGGMGTVEEQVANADRAEVYLPRLQTSILQTVSNIQPTTLTATNLSAPDLTDEQRQSLSIVVSPGSAVDQNGNVIANPQIGFSTVPPELVRDMLPAGIMQLSATLTLQAPGVARFTQPLEMTFPNVYGAAPGTQLFVYSFDHNTGKLAITGTATVSSDGKSAVTDPGSGITFPGWFGVTPPQSCVGSGGDAPLVVPEEPTPTPIIQTLKLIVDETGVLEIPAWRAPNALPGTPAPSTGNKIALSAPDVGAEKQPYLKVDIEVDGPLAQFMEKTGNINLESTSFILRAGSGDVRSFGVKALPFEKVKLDSGGLLRLDFTRLERDLLFGSKITVKETEQKSDGSIVSKSAIYFLYRFIDATDANHTDSTISFAQTIDDGQGGVRREVPLQVLSGNSTPIITIADRTNFGDAGTLLRTVFFDPSSTAADPPTASDPSPNHQHAFLNIQNPEDNTLAGTIMLSGEPIASQRWKFDSVSFATLANAISQDNGTLFPGIDSSARSFLSNPVQALTDLAQRTDFLFREAGLAGGIHQVPASAPDSDVITISFVQGPNPLPGSNDWVLGGAVNADGGMLATLASMKDLYLHQSMYSDHQLSYLVGEVLNNDLPGRIEFLMDNILEAPGNGITTYDEFKNALGMNNAHEIGHFLDLFHTGNDGATYVGALVSLPVIGGPPLTFGGSGSDDIMRQGLDTSGSKRFDLTRSAAKIALHLDYTIEDVRRALEYYADYASAKQGHPSWNGNAIGDALDGNEGPQVTLVEGPFLSITDPDTRIVGQSVNLGTVIADGPNESRIEKTWILQNHGTSPLEIERIFAGDNGSGITVDSSNTQTLLAAGEATIITVRFDPTTVGTFSNVISVVTANAGTREVSVFGQAIAAEPRAVVELQNNNMGGAFIGQASSKIAASLRNVGAQHLVISGVRIIEGAGAFDVSDLTTKLLQGPISLATNESIDLSVQFTPQALGLARGIIEVTTTDVANLVSRLTVVGTGLSELIMPDWGNDFVSVQVGAAGTTQVFRSVSDPSGRFLVSAAPAAQYSLVIFDPVTGLVAHGSGQFGAAGQGTNIVASLVFDASISKDSDQDGLPDDIESAVGTKANRADTDKDGLSDLVEIQQGLDPLVALQIPTSIVSAVTLKGTAQSVVVEGSTADPSKVTAYVATSQDGLALVAVQQFTKPIVLGTLDLAGNNTDVAADPARNIAAVAGGAVGLHLVNVADATAPTLMQTIVLADGANRVEILDGFAYVASGSKLVSIDITTGEIRQQLDLHGGTLTDIAVDGSTLYTMDSTRTLLAVTVSTLRMTARGSLVMPVGGGQLFVGNGIAYVAAETSSQGGLATANVANPDNLTLISGVDAIDIAGTALALNGSGLAVSVGSPGTGGNVIQVLNLADPAVTDNLVVQYTLPVDPFDVAIAAGLAFVADGSGGLLVVNYLPFDRAGQAPTVSITEQATDADLVTPGIQVLEGRSFRVLANVRDDVQVRTVELLVNNQVVTNDVAFPWDLVATAPAIAAGGTTLTIQVRATDTGGNVTLSAPLVFDVIPDTFPPLVTETSPLEGARPFFVKSFDIRFDEPIDQNVINLAGAHLTNLGADGQFGTADDTATSIGSFTLRDTDSFLSLYPAEALAAGDYRFVVDPAIIADRAGNYLAAPLTLNFTIRPASEVKAASGTPAIVQAPSANPGQAIGIEVPWGPSAARMTFPTRDSSGNLSSVTVTPVGVAAASNVAFFVVPDTAVTDDVTMFAGGVNNYTGLPNWNVTRGSVDLFGNGFNDFLPGNGLYLDLDGSTSAAGRLESKASFDLTPGTYQLQFNIAGSQRFDSNTVTVSLGTAFSEAFTFTSATPRTTVTRTITVAAGQSARLVFDHAGGDNSGLLLTSVKLTRNDTSAVLLDENFELPFADGTFPLQIVPVVSGLDVTSVAYDGSTAAVTLTGRGFIEGADSRYRVGTVELVDGNAFTGPDVSSYYEYPPGQYIDNGLVYLTVPLSAGVVGPIAVQTAGGTSAPFTVGFTGVSATALSGTPADPAQASANPGQAITLTGSGLTTTTDVILSYRDVNGTSQTVLLNPLFAAADGTSATLVVPWYLNGVTPVQVIGATVWPTLQIVPTLTSLDVQSGSLVLYGAGFVEGASTYQVPGATVVDTQVSGGVDVSYGNTASNQNNQNGSATFSPTVLPRYGLGPVTVTTAGGTSTPLALTALQPGSETTAVGALGDVAIDPTTGALWVVDQASPGHLLRIDPATGAVLHTITLTTAFGSTSTSGNMGLQILGSAISLGGTSVPAGSLLLFNGYAGPDQVTAIHPTTGAVLATVTLAQNYELTAGLYDPASGHLFVTDARGSANHLVELDPTTGVELASVQVPFPVYSYAGLALDPVSGNLWLGSYSGGPQVVELTRTGTEVRRVDLTSQGLHANELSGLAFAPDGALLIASLRGVVYQTTLTPVPLDAPTLTGITAVAAGGTPLTSGQASANVGQIIELAGTNFRSSDLQIQFATRDNSGVESTIAVAPFVVSADGTRAQVVVPDLAETGRVNVTRVGSQDLNAQGYNDALYRNITLDFTPTSSTAQLRFSDSGLEGIFNESWGLDNVQVALAATPTTLLFQDTFEGGAQAAWSSAVTDNTLPAVFSQFSGRFSNQSQTLTLTGLTPGQPHRLTFDLYVLDSWDGTNTSQGPDFFDVTVDTTRLFHETFSNTQTNLQTFGATGNVPVQIVPVLSGLSNGRPGQDSLMTLTGSGFMEGASTLTIGGRVIPDQWTNLSSDFDVTGSRNDSYQIAVPLAVEGPIRVTTAGGFFELAGPTVVPPAFVRFTGLTATAQYGTPTDLLQPSANTGQRITLQGQGFTSSTWVQFSAIDETGLLGTLTRTGVASADGQTLTVEVPALARTGVVQVVGDATTVPLQIVPTLRAVGGTLTPGSPLILEGSGVNRTELRVRIDGQLATVQSVHTLIDGTDQFSGTGDVTRDQQLITLLVPANITTGVITATTDGGTATLQTAVSITQAPPLTLAADVGDTLATARLVTLAPNSQLSIDPNTGIGDNAFAGRDVDLFRLELLAGERLVLDLDAQTIGFPLNSVLRLFNAVGSQLASNNDFGGSLDAFLNFAVPTSGTYYVGVSGSANTTYNPNTANSGTLGSTGDYVLKIQRGAVTGTTLSGITATASSGTPAQTGVPSAVVGQAITLTGSGLRSSDQVLFTGLDSSGNLFDLTATPTSVAADGTSLQVVVPVEAVSGRVRLQGDTVGLFVQVVPTLTDVSGSAGSPFHNSALQLTGSGFAEGNVTIGFGTQALVDSGRFTGPDVTSNSSLSLTVPNGVPTGPLTITTAGGTSAPFGLTVTGLVATAATGTPADAAAASANPGQAITLQGSGLDLTTDVVFLTRDASGTVTEQVVKPTAASATQLTVVVPDTAVTGPVRVVGDQNNTQIPLQIVPVVGGLDVTSVAYDGSTAAVTLTGRGFIEGADSRYRVGTVELVDGNAFTGPDVSSYYEYPPGQYIDNGLVYLTVPLSAGVVGPIAVQTAGGTSAPFTVGFTGVSATALSGTPADPAQASANPGQAITLTGSGLTTTTDVILSYRDVNGTSQTVLLNPLFAAADGTSATLVVPSYANGAFTLQVIGAVVAPRLQIVPVVTNIDVFTTNYADLRGAGFVEGHGSVYQIGSTLVTDMSVSDALDVTGFNQINDRVILPLPVSGPGTFTVQTTGGTSAPVAWNVLSPGLGALIDVAYDPATSSLWVADNNNISGVSKTTGAVLNTFDIPASGFTSNLGLQFVSTGFTLNGTAVPTGSLLITNGNAFNDQFIAVNATTGAVIASLTVGTNFDFVAGVYHAGRNSLFGLNGSPDQLIEINPATGATINAFALGFDVQSGGLAIDATGNIWISTNADSSVRRFNVTTNTVDQTIDLAKDSIATELTGLANEAPGFLIGSSNRGVVYFQLDPPVGDAPAPTVAMESSSAATEVQPAAASGNLELAYVQQAWVKDYVNGTVVTNDEEVEDELVIRLQEPALA